MAPISYRPERLAGPKDPEIPLLTVQLRHVAQETPEHMRIADAARSRERS
jgi:hypothetical protein